MSSVRPVAWSGWREDVKNALQRLSDRNLQDRYWHSGVRVPGDLTDAVHWLIDDTWWDHRPAHESIPLVLRDKAEADSVQRTVTALLRVLEDLGPVARTHDYLGHHEWHEVLTTARAAYLLLARNDGEEPSVLPVVPAHP
jgi:hypothetical protein